MTPAEPGPWRLLSACLLGVVISLLAYTLYLTEAWAYLSDDPFACANCHRMEDSVNSWVASSHHAEAGCNDCHASRTPGVRQVHQAMDGIRHGWKFTLGVGSVEPRLREASARLIENNCIRCHRDLLAAGVPAGRGVTGGRCTRCHRAVGHR